MHNQDSARALRLGVVGYGVGGRFFHTPFVDAAEAIDLVGVVTRSPERKALVERDWPQTPTFDSLGDLLAAGVDAVTITTPPATRRELVLEAVAGGVHVIADKPFAPDAQSARDLADAASEANVMLNVFHNRRWDADIQTLAKLIRAGALGDLWRVHSRMDQDNADSLEAGPTGGLLRDLGSHVVDQLLWLLGPVLSVSAHLDWVELPEGRTDVGFVIDLRHESGVRSFVESSKINHLEQREFRAYGSQGSYWALGTDVQAQASLRGLRPAANLETWGYEDPSRWGRLRTATGEQAVPSEQGRYHDFYTQFAAAWRGDGPQPVPAVEGVRTLEVLEAVRLSAERGKAIDIRLPST